MPKMSNLLTLTFHVGKLTEIFPVKVDEVSISDWLYKVKVLSKNTETNLFRCDKDFENHLLTLLSTNS